MPNGLSDELLVWAAPIGSWLVTYVIHSAILIALAYVVVRRLESRRPQLGDVAWKIALVGALVTASVQVGTGITPVGGALSPTTAEASESTTGPLLESHWAMVAEALATPAPEATPRPAPGIVRRSTPAPIADVAELDEPPRIAGANLAPVETEIVVVERSPAWLAAAIAAWLAGALLFGGGLLLSWVKLRWMLRRREPIKGKPAELLDRVAWRAGLRQPIRLSMVEGLDVPIAFGVLEPEIALPARAERLDPDQLETLLAHECAHLVRRDPGWRLLAAAVRSVLWVQPLNRLVCRRLESCSELCADDWAVAHTDRPLELARCLTEVARWLTPRGLGSTVPAMARPGSVLGTRVRRLVDKSDRGRDGSRWFGVAAIAVVIGIAFAAPGASNAAAPVDTVLPTAAVAAPDAESAELVEQVALGADSERAAAAVRELVARSSDEVQLDELLGKLDSGQLDATLNQWLKGPDDDDWDFDFDFDFDVQLGDDDDDDDDDDDNGDDDDDDDGADEWKLLDPGDFIKELNKHPVEPPIDLRKIHPGLDLSNQACTECHTPGQFVPARPPVDIEIDIDTCEDGKAKGGVWNHRGRIDRDAAREMARRAREMARRARHEARAHARAARRQAREHARHARRAAREARRRAFREAIEAQRGALREAMKAKGEALKNAEHARREVERAMREAERALREAERLRQKMGGHHNDNDSDDDDDVDVDVLITPTP